MAAKAAVASESVANIGVDGEEFAARAGPEGAAARAYLRGTQGAFAAAQSSADAAAVLVGVLLDERPPFRLQTSAAATAFTGAKLADLRPPTSGHRLNRLLSGATREQVDASQKPYDAPTSR